jgi:HEPN domain-containing protein
MSVEKNREQAMRWFITAQDDLQSSEILHANLKFAQSCFYAQQAGEKALKAMYFSRDIEPWGHSLLKLSKEFVGTNEDMKQMKQIEKDFRDLDRYYIPTRYPDGLPGTTPAEAYGSEDSEAAIKSAKSILSFVQSKLDATQK